MRYLIDTHIFISLINKDDTFINKSIKSIEDVNNDIFLSIASIWEIVIKINIGKLTLTRNLQEMYNLIENLNISVLNIQKLHLDTYLTLPIIHRDPFDRIIISQAIADDLTLITDDQHIRNYPNLKLL
ncbi:type II toxin-antitoxin system VapC family toxin [Pedobacter fastidiosus]|uniref:Type II toxin-antitoxin system VapC family toxin n=1 Tax=Pedobacter fastidiosus TaxID=2765361 RepID=A0ABR7KWA4_9SPHI|nr:type II toxin-antitoxin system VapC family toxin [Pedobacter fastidiosus]MBC6112321.1 type II toxin-antitoxin system VapC family toxin [Pedobacter fastidiosus]